MPFKINFIILIMLPVLLRAQPAIEWQRCYGGSGSDWGSAIITTSDSGYALVGGTTSTDGDVTGVHGNSYDMWVVKTNSLGNIQWNKCLGSFAGDGGTSIKQTKDGGYIAAGQANANGGDVTGNHNGNDSWVVKLDSVGVLQWQKCLGGSSGELANNILNLDSFYIVTNTAGSYDGDVTGQHGTGTTGDYWIVKLDSIGNIIWEKAFGGSNSEETFTTITTQDGGYLICGYTTSNDGDITFNHGTYDCWLVKVDANGNMQWQKTYGGSNGEDACSVVQLNDGTYLMAGNVSSTDGDVAFIHGGADYWAVKLDTVGNIIWEKSYGGSDIERCRSIIKDDDGGFLLEGHTDSYDQQVTGQHGSWDYWIIKIDSIGNLIWQKTLGGSSGDFNAAYQMICKTLDGGVIVIGTTDSNDGDVMGNHGGTDYWVVKLGNTTHLNNIPVGFTGEVYPNPATDYVTVGLSSFIKHPNLILYDMAGKKIKCVKTDKTDLYRINISDLQNGIYLLQLFDNNMFLDCKRVIVLK